MKKNILVTAVGGRSVGSGIVHALMRANGSSARDKWNVIAADADCFSWGLYIADKAVLLPRAEDADYLPSVLDTIQKEKVDAVIPGSEPEANVFATYRDQVPVPVICNRAELMPLMLDKFSMMAKLKELGLPYIETLPIGHWRTALSKHDFPFVIKPTVGTGGSRGLHFVCSREELEDLLPQLPEAGRFCIQPYVGTGEDEYTVGVITDQDGWLIDSIVMRRKLLGLSLLHHRSYQRKSYTISTGYSQGFFVRDKAVQEFCESLAQSIQSVGPLNIQLRKKGDEIYVFEIHPRFSGTSTMRADLGFNEPDVLLRNALYGEKFGWLNYRFDVAAIRAFEHVIVPINEMLSKEQ